MFKANLFKSLLMARNKTVDDIAQIIGVNKVTLYRKMNGVSDFTRNEIQLIRHELALSADEVTDIFFAD